MKIIFFLRETCIDSHNDPRSTLRVLPHEQMELQWIMLHSSDHTNGQLNQRCRMQTYHHQLHLANEKNSSKHWMSE